MSDLPDVPGMRVDPARICRLNNARQLPGAVVYWMGRDQRVDDNWAFIHAQDLALASRVPLIVVFCLVPSFSGAGFRQYDYMIRGLRETAERCLAVNVPFILLSGNPAEEIPEMLRRVEAGALVVDFDPLRIRRTWIDAVVRDVSVAVHEVDAHNIVPCRFVSDHREYAARTIRPKIHRALDRFLTMFPAIESHPVPSVRTLPVPDWDTAHRIAKSTADVPPIEWLVPGFTAASGQLHEAVSHKLTDYASRSNDPNSDSQSDLSPYLHFGQISAQRVALEVVHDPHVPDDSRDAFLEQLIVRRELTDNYCLHTESYDSVAGLPDWALRTLDMHREDPREYVYDRGEFERAATHDRLWNAAQREMLERGKMHNYLRMYWAKKILEWSPSPESAIETALYLNDRYELDGRDPNGFVGVLWSIGGLHDRPWSERQVFGTIRYMNEAGCRRKFDVARYIERFGA